MKILAFIEYILCRKVIKLYKTKYLVQCSLLRLFQQIKDKLDIKIRETAFTLD